MRVAVVDNNYLANKDNVKNFLEYQGYNNIVYDVFSFQSWGRFQLAMCPEINFEKCSSIDEVTSKIWQNGHDAVFVSLDRPNDYASDILRTLEKMENLYLISNSQIRHYNNKT